MTTNVMLHDWDDAPLPEHVFFQEGPGLRVWQWTECGMKVVNGTNILLDGQIDIGNTDKFISLDEFNQKYRHFAISEGDILVTSSGTIGKVAVVKPEHLPLMMNTSVIRFRAKRKERLDDGFLLAFLRSSVFQNQVSAVAIGAAQLNFGPVHLKQMRIPLAPLPIQRRIASILSAYDDLIENNRKRIAILEDMARRLYREWFVHFRYPGHESIPLVDSPVGRIPQGWESGKLGNVVDLRWGDTSKTKAAYVDSGFDAYSASGLDGKLDHFDFDRQGIVLSAIGANCGMTWLANGKWSCIKNTIRYWPTDPRIGIEYLFLATQGIAYWTRRGAAQPFISQGDAQAAPILTPSIDVSSAFSAHAGPWFELTANLHQQIGNLRRTRDLLLPRLMSGQLSVTAAEAAVP